MVKRVQLYHTGLYSLHFMQDICCNDVQMISITVEQEQNSRMSRVLKGQRGK